MGAGRSRAGAEPAPAAVISAAGTMRSRGGAGRGPSRHLPPPRLLHAQMRPALGDALNRAQPPPAGSTSRPGSTCPQLFPTPPCRGILFAAGDDYPPPAGPFVPVWASVRATWTERGRGYDRRRPRLRGGPLSALRGLRREIDPSAFPRVVEAAVRGMPPMSNDGTPTHRHESVTGGIKPNPEPAGVPGLPSRRRPVCRATGAHRGHPWHRGGREGRPGEGAPFPRRPPLRSAGAWRAASPPHTAGRPRA